MSERIKVRGYLQVTITVPHEFTIDRDELDEWLTEDGGPPWDGSAEDVAEFIRSGDPADWQGGWPKADPDWHVVDGAELINVDILGRVT